MSDPLLPPPAVLVEVKKVLPFGLLVGLSDGGEGIIRERELAWGDHNRTGWRRRFRPGQQLSAIPLGAGRDERPEFSLRLADSDPWGTVTERYPLGRLVQGTVTGVQPYGAFIELEPGVTGLLHITRLPSAVQQHNLTALFWHGDHVRVTIERLDPKNRQIGLSLGRALLRRWEGRQPPTASGTPPTVPTTDPDPAVLEDPALPSWRVLAVEDDAAQLRALAGWMEQAGLLVRPAQSAEEALALLGEEPPDLVLTDFGLPGMSGVELLRELRERWPGLRTALMTDWARASEQLGLIEELRHQGTHLLIKPLRPDDLTALLTSDAPLVDESDESVELAIDLAPLPTIEEPRSDQLSWTLRRICKATGASQAVIFAVSSPKRQVTIVETHGSAELNREALVDLFHSPVRNVAEERLLLRIDDAKQVEPRMRYLTPLLDFRSCLGLRLPANLPEHYALFLFSPQPRAFSDVHLEHARAAAVAAAALIEREQFQIHALDLQRLALLGQLSRALAHEINHQLSPINFMLHGIGRQFSTLEQSVARTPEQLGERLASVGETLQDLSQSVRNLTDTARLFGRLAVQTREQTVALRDVLHETVLLVRDMADRAHIALDLVVDDDAPLIRIHQTQIQQMVLNILINAVQQLQIMRQQPIGRVAIQARRALIGGRLLAQICIEDDGPGIHHQLWERIFELGFTTRTDEGSGLGLHITRSLAEANNGRVYVTESAILWGSTLVIELPAIDGV
ncbi:MAG TPA: response regulator [Roseiflexaceae bacterium]|nr:response regulator [Roseiflexaceae bacterium]